MKKISDNKFTEEGNYDSYIDAVQRDYIDQIEVLDKWFKRLSTIRAICILSIPLLLVIDIKSIKAWIALTSVIASLCEFYIKFKNYDTKLKNLNNASISLTYEYNLFSEKAGCYSNIDVNKAKITYVENTSAIIKDIDIRNEYNTSESDRVIDSNKSAK